MSGEAVRRLDRVAARMGVPLTHEGAVRCFELPRVGRTIKYRAQGKGSFVVGAYEDGRLEAETVCGEGRIATLLTRAMREG